ncbi:MAG: hypothetical protein K5694_06625 [Bacilli bacterium]|nr:hypothetical protein [Bacilli bacterium]
MKKKLLSLLSFPILLMGCAQNYSNYPEWCRDYLRSGYTYTESFPIEKAAEYLKNEVAFPGLTSDKGFIYGTTPPTDGKPPYFQIVVPSVMRESLVSTLLTLSYSEPKSYERHNFLIHDTYGYGVKVSDIYKSEKELTTPYMTDIDFYLVKDVPYAN